MPDLTPRDRPAWAGFHPRFVFVAESPHRNEIEPEGEMERRPLCGMAGRKWWGALSEVIEGEANEDVSLERMRRFCVSHGIAVLNAVQRPLDFADPIRILGFNKAPGPHHYKKMKNSPEVCATLESLGERLCDPRIRGLPIHCLGNDAEWFVSRVLEQASCGELVLGPKIPHPSAWWRRGGHFGRVAKAQLEAMFPRSP